MTTTNPADIDADSHEDRKNRTELAFGRKSDPPSTLSAADADQLRTAVSDDPVSLPKNRIPCCACGVATEYPRTKAALIKVPRFASTASGKIGTLTGHVLLGRCQSCADRRQLALKIAASHPRASAQLGGIVVDAIEHALIALHVLGKPLPTPEISDAELGSMIRTLSTAGRTACWQDVAAEHSGQCSRRPFAHVRQDVRTTLLRAFMDHYAEILKMRRPPVQVPPPKATGRAEIKINDGCLMCGVDHVDVPALRVHRLGGPVAAGKTIWRQVESVAPTSIGGPGVPERVSGSVCPDCSAAIGSAGGGVGESAMEIALARRLEALGDQGTAAVIKAGERLVIGWGGLVVRARTANQPDPAPNTEPWGHVTLDVARSGASSAPADHHTGQAVLEAS